MASGKMFRDAPRALAAAFALVLAPFVQAETPPPPSQPTVVETGHSAMWFAPERDGEGWVLEILDDERATLTWFTYDDAGAQRWLYSLGSIVEDEDGQRIAFPELRVNRGGRFGEGFDPDAIETEIVGSLSLRFSDCHRGQLEYDAYGHAQTIDIQRVVSRTMASGCAPIHGVTGEPIHPLAAQSGNWFDPTRNGEGFELQWTATGLAVLSWYTYADDGSNRWLTGVGQREGEGEEERIVFPELYTTRGGRFGENYDPTLVERVVWGSLELTIGCDTGVASFASSLPEFGNGTRELVQLTRAVPAACPWVPPKLTDLYDVEYVELPIPYNAPPLPQATRIEVHGIADDGTVLGSSYSSPGPMAIILLLRPRSQEWEVIGDTSLRLQHPIFFAPDGRTVYARKKMDETVNQGLGTLLMRWREGIGWEELPDTRKYSSSGILGMSRDGTHLTGTGSHAGNSRAHPWKWSEATGFVELLLSDEIPGGYPQDISNDGQTVIGVTIIGQQGSLPIWGAIQWRGDNPPERLYAPNDQPLAIARLCNADCSLIFGEGWPIPDMNNPVSYQPWVIGKNERFFYLDYPAPVQPLGYGARTAKVSSDGSIMAGVYAVPTPGFFYEETWLWTQNTGSVSFLELMESISGGEEMWPNRDTRTPAGMSADGKYILLKGIIPQNTSSWTRYPSAILRLIPKTSKESGVTTRPR